MSLFYPHKLRNYGPLLFIYYYLLLSVSLLEGELEGKNWVLFAVCTVSTAKPVKGNPRALCTLTPSLLE